VYQFKTIYVMTEKSDPRELFATPEDIIRAHEIVEEELGGGFDVNYMGMPKNVGVMGDERVLGHSVVLSALGPNKLNPDDEEDSERLERVMLRICNETKAASRVLLDITPDNSYFRKDRR
jgi:GMP synthase PP-ATPase subunit